MGLFGSIGKAIGGAFKVAGKVAGVASAIAPIPGLGFAGKVAGGIGGILGKAQRAKAAAGKVLGPGAISALSSVMPGGSLANQSFYQSGYVGSGAGPGGVASGVRALSKAMGGRKRRKKTTKRRKARAGGKKRRRRGGKYYRGRYYTAAQVRAGFAG